MDNQTSQPVNQTVSQQARHLDNQTTNHSLSL